MLHKYFKVYKTKGDLNLITFPKEEYESIRKDLDRNGYCYTTRVSNEIGKYAIGSLYKTPWGETIIIDGIKNYQKISNHPFYNELSKSQIKLIAKYSEDIYKPFAVVKFSRYTKKTRVTSKY